MEHKYIRASRVLDFITKHIESSKYMNDCVQFAKTVSGKDLPSLRELVVRIQLLCDNIPTHLARPNERQILRKAVIMIFDFDLDFAQSSTLQLSFPALSNPQIIF